MSWGYLGVGSLGTLFEYCFLGFFKNKIFWLTSSQIALKVQAGVKRPSPAKQNVLSGCIGNNIQIK